eukprot:1139584-Pelagomonas_calceolata.AAC.2
MRTQVRRSAWTGGKAAPGMQGRCKPPGFEVGPGRGMRAGIPVGRGFALRVGLWVRLLEDPGAQQFCPNAAPTAAAAAAPALAALLQGDAGGRGDGARALDWAALRCCCSAAAGALPGAAPEAIPEALLSGGEAVAVAAAAAPAASRGARTAAFDAPCAEPFPDGGVKTRGTDTPLRAREKAGTCLEGDGEIGNVPAGSSLRIRYAEAGGKLSRQSRPTSAR